MLLSIFQPLELAGPDGSHIRSFSQFLPCHLLKVVLSDNARLALNDWKESLYFNSISSMLGRFAAALVSPTARVDGLFVKDTSESVILKPLM